MSLGSADLAQLLLALTLLVIAAHGVGHVFAKLRQPRVIGEIIGGLLLGPTLFGMLAPDLQARVFPSDGPTAAFLGATYQLGLLLLMFCSGAEMRAVFKRGEERSVSFITITGVAVPFLLGLLLVRVTDTGPLMGPAHSRAALVLVFALAIAVTSIPVISRIMFDLGILHTSFARIVLGVAVIEDVIVYIVLAIALGLAAGTQGNSDFGVTVWLGLHSGSASYMAFHVAATLVFFVFMLTAGAWLFRRTLRLRVNILKRSSPIAYQLLFVFVATLVCVLLGITALFGAFLAGIVSSTASGTAAAEARGAVKDFAFAFFVPVYFAIVGLQLDLVHHFNPLFFLWFLLFACVAKTAAVYLGARMGRERTRTAVNLAVAMNARGGPGIVLASVTYSAGDQPILPRRADHAGHRHLARGRHLARTRRPYRPAAARGRHPACPERLLLGARQRVTRQPERQNVPVLCEVAGVGDPLGPIAPGRRPGVREALIRSEREWNDQVEGWGLAAPSRSLLDALTAGEAVVVPAWQVSEFLPVLLWRWQERWGRDVRVERDGRSSRCGPSETRAGRCTWPAGNRSRLRVDTSRADRDTEDPDHRDGERFGHYLDHDVSAAA